MKSNSIRVNFLPERGGVKKKIYKSLVIFSMTALILNMSFIGVFFVGANEALACHGDIKIIKDTGGVASPDFTFTANGYSAIYKHNYGPVSFTLAGDEYRLFDRLEGGDYTFSETDLPAGWKFSHIECIGGDTVVSGNSVDITLDNNENIVCTFYNEKEKNKDDCKEVLGDDYFTVAKWDWDEVSSNYINYDGDYTGYTTNVGGDTNQATWESNPAVAKVVRKAGNEPFGIFDGGLSGAVTKDTKDISHISLCGGPICGDGNLDSGEECDDGNTDNGDGCNESCNKEVIVKAYKVICDDESDLPNWGEGEVNLITANTASDYIDQHPNCRWAETWDFQYGESNINSFYDGDFVGPVSEDDWYDFPVSASSSEPAKLVLDWEENMNKLWFREVLKEGYIPYAYPPPPSTGNLYSAELYCDDDILNYDNMEWIDWVPERDKYYCIAFNVPNEVKTYCGDGTRQQPNSNGEYEECDINDGVGLHQTCSANCTLEDLTYCGDDKIQSPNDDGLYEMCDGNDPQICTATGGYSGLKTCTNCLWSNCETQESCGDGVKNGNEECDENDGVGPHQTCSDNCTLEDLTYCGDDIIQWPNSYNFYEYCDGNIPEDCITSQGYSGLKTCTNCSWSSCVPQESCGDDVKNGDEECDGLAGVGPHQTCSDNCTLEDLTYCGDDIIQWPNSYNFYEECDGNNPKDCVTTNGYKGLETCTGCLWDSCDPQEWCGDGIKNGNEQCDGDQGVGANQICSVNCTLDDLTYCGDGTIQSPNSDGFYEECDGSDGVGANQICTTNCILEDLTFCGDDIIQWPNSNGEYEKCDGSSDCNADCTFKDDPYCDEGSVVILSDYIDYVDIGNTVSEMGHFWTGWTNEWVKPGWGGNYGEGSDDGSFRLLMGPGDGCEPGTEVAIIEMDAGTDYANELTLNHLDGSQADSFDVYINDIKIGHYEHNQQNNEVWATTTYSFPPVSKKFEVKLMATKPAESWCSSWGQVAFSYIGVKGFTCEEQVCSENSFDWNVLDRIDIGENNSMLLHNALSWQSDPATGNYGGRDGGETIAMVRGDSNECSEEFAFASFVLHNTGEASKLSIRHLDGMSLLDSFEVWINGTQIGTYTDDNSDQEVWLTTEFDLSDSLPNILNVELKATEPAWNMCSTYGQVALNWVELKGCGTPWEPTCDGSSQNWNMLDRVDIGDSASEYYHSINGWTEANLPGNYGGCQQGAVCSYRQVIEDPCTSSEKEANILLHSGSNIISELKVRHLDGISLLDSFEIWNGNTKIAEWLDTTIEVTEVWKETIFDIAQYNLSGDITLTFKATNDIWSNCTTYGQVSIDWVEMYGCGTPWQPETGELKICKYYDNETIGQNEQGIDTPLAWDMIVTYPNQGGVLYTRTNEETGCVTIQDLPFGSYQIAEVANSGWIMSYPSVNNQIVDISQNNPSVNVVFLNYEGGGPQLGSIEVCKFIDEDGLASTTGDRYEATTTPWTFNLYDGNSTSTATTTAGSYCVTFNNLSAGTYNVSEVEQNGWTILYPDQKEYDVNLASGQHLTLDFVNTAYQEEVKGKISGYKYNDANNNGVIDSGEQKMSGWLMQLIGCPYAPLGTSTIQFLSNSAWNTVSTGTLPISGQCAIIASTTTDSTGYYEFSGLDGRDYGVSEVITDIDWSQTYPANDTFYYFNLLDGENKTDISFANYKPGDIHQPYCGDGRVDSGEQCDDGNNVSGDGCSASCQTEGGGGGGGGGGCPDCYDIYDPYVAVVDCKYVVTWRTSKAATSRVIYDTVSHPDISSEVAPNYGYAYSTAEDGTKVTGHSVTISGLEANTTYYFRPISKASPEKYGKEISLTITDPDCCTIVKGEEGEPDLEITKSVAQPFANPGDEGIEYIITVTNNGNLTAYGVTLSDLLPTGLSYSDSSSGDISKNWDLGDIEPGESKAVTYMVDVDSDALADVYTNTAEAIADNHEAVTADANLEVKTIKVLAETGFNQIELILMILSILGLAGASTALRRRIA